MSDAVRSHRWQPTRLPRPWDSLGKNTGVDCHFLLQCMKGKSQSEVAQSCLTLSDPMDCSLPGSSVHGIPQAGILEGVSIPFFRRSSHYMAAAAKSLSRVLLCATPWTAAYQAPPSLGFSRLEYWSRVPLPSLPRLCSGKEFTCQCRRLRFYPLVRKIPWRREWQPTPVFLPGESHGQRSFVDCSPWGLQRIGHN